MTASMIPEPYSPVVEAEKYLTAAAESDAVAQHLDGVAMVLIREGWTQGSFRDGGFCLFGALQRAAELGYGDPLIVPGVPVEDTTHFRAGHLLNERIAARGGTDWILAWNDVPGRTFDEVLDLVREAADIARAAAWGESQ